MVLLIAVTIALVIATTAAALSTGGKLAEQKRVVYQLEMGREELRRQLYEAELRRRTLDDSVDLLMKLKAEKRAVISAMANELRELEAGTPPEISVNKALQPKAFDLAQVGALA